MRGEWRILTTAVGLLVVAGPASAGDVAAGRDIAITWCSACHAVPGVPTAADAAPPLSDLAKRSGLGPDRLRGFLSEPHGEMKELPLTHHEIGHLIAYITSLTRH